MVAGGHNPTEDLSGFTTKVTASDTITAYLKRKHEQGFLTITRRKSVRICLGLKRPLTKHYGVLRRKEESKTRSMAIGNYQKMSREM